MPFHTYRFRPRVGAYCIRPTNDPERGEYVQNRTTVSRNRARITQNRMDPAYIQKWITQIHGVRFLPKTVVGRMLLRPTRGRKRYAQDVVIRARLHETFVRFCTYSSRSGSFVGRIQYAPTWGYEMVMRFCGIRFRVHKMVMHIGLSLFFGR